MWPVHLSFSSINKPRYLTLSVFTRISQFRKRKTLCRQVYLTRRPSYFFHGRERRPCVVSEKIRGGRRSYKGGAVNRAARSKIGRRRRHTDHPHADHTRMARTQTPTSAVWKCRGVWVLPFLHHPRFSSHKFGVYMKFVNLGREASPARPAGKRAEKFTE